MPLIRTNVTNFVTRYQTEAFLGTAPYDVYDVFLRDVSKTGMATGEYFGEGDVAVGRDGEVEGLCLVAQEPG
eukprot:CAMPEP_0172496296 /NCGR_PEP_ID=MMETSP1066-20121228/84915_1 /TAXON_ID=671091 /ORGANISM="Coscinodiscus wailesii, Strain CCMP2513" /LENGTH=71 /DNA_ID=CAMNT_0013268517 /DNA_START=453 /DNA_END=668 /DNA_ORIENTATION=-